MTSIHARTSMLTLAAFAISGSIALGQQPATEMPPTQPAAPVERQPPSDQMGDPGMHRGMGPGGMRDGMQDRHAGPPPNFRVSGMQGRDSFHRGPEGFHHGPEREEMEHGFHIGPGGMWWKNPMIVQRLTLTPEQTKKMDGIFQESRLRLIDLKATLEKQEIILEPLLGASPLDTARAMAQIDKVAQSRADLEKANARMLLGIRAVLTPGQWAMLSERRGAGDRPQAGAEPPVAPAAPAGRTRGLHGSGGPSPNATKPSGNSPQ